MNAKSALTTAASLACLLLAPAAALAGPIFGSFTGLATSGEFAGDHATGSFGFDSVAGAITIAMGDYILPAGDVTLSFDIAGQLFSFPNRGDSNSSSIMLGQNGTTQSVFLSTDYPTYLGNSIELTGPIGSLFSNVDDLASLHAGAGVSIYDPIQFYPGKEQSVVDIAVTSEVINGVAIPEPATALLVAPLLAFLASRRSKKLA